MDIKTLQKLALGGVITSEQYQQLAGTPGDPPPIDESVYKDSFYQTVDNKYKTYDIK